MTVTINEIAKIAGVSRGTVDRVLNNRGKVKAEKAELIKQVANDLGYKPNIAAKGLSAKKKSLVIGIIISAEGNSFFDEVINGIKYEEKKIADYGVKIELYKIKGYDIEEQIKLIDELKDKINVLILNPIMDRAIEEKIDELTNQGIPVINLNTDVENSKRLCYVGTDYYKGGKIAGGMTTLIAKDSTQVGVITGSFKILGHNQRIDGFKDIIKDKKSNIKIMDIKECNDDDNEAFIKTKEMLGKYNNINFIYCVAAGIQGVCNAIKELNFQDKVDVVCFDSYENIVEFMKDGIIKATIVQRPFVQGSKVVNIAFNYLVLGVKPDEDKIIISNEIKITENIY